MPRNSSTAPAAVPRTKPSSVRTIGAPPEPACAVAAPTVAAVAPVAVRVSAASAALQAAASEARREWVVFMILTPSVSPVAACHCFAGPAACHGDTPPSEALARCGLVARGGGHAHPSWLLPRWRERGGSVVGPVDGQLALRMGSARR